MELSTELDNEQINEFFQSAFEEMKRIEDHIKYGDLNEEDLQDINDRINSVFNDIDRENKISVFCVSRLKNRS